MLQPNDTVHAALPPEALGISALTTCPKVGELY